MNLRQLIDEANVLSDEFLEDVSMTQFVNQCMAQINTRAKANFPYMDSSLPETEFIIPEKWVRRLFIPFIAGRTKQVDSSQFEYSDFYAEFESAMGDFMANYPIPDAYKDTSGDQYVDPVTGEIKYYTSDVYDKPPIPWWRW